MFRFVYLHFIQAIVAAMNIVMLVPTSTILGIMMVEQLYLIVNNLTTIEKSALEQDYALRGYNEYNIDMFFNIQAVMGRNALFWLIPQKQVGEPFSFPVSSTVKTE